MTNKTEILRRLEAARLQIREWQRDTTFKAMDVPREWVGEVGATLAALNPNTAQEFFSLLRGFAGEDVGKGDLEDFFAEQIGGLRAEIALTKTPPSDSSSHPRSPRGNRVFLVHGHDEGFAQTAARFVEKFGLECIILHEQANEGKTLIEKFLAHAEGVDFAIALWTADDEGHAKGDEHLKPRARQNVVFETGFFIGALGRERVCVIFEPGIELPSDYSGVVYLPKSEWKERLLRELRAAELPLTSFDESERKGPSELLETLGPRLVPVKVVVDRRALISVGANAPDSEVYCASVLLKNDPGGSHPTAQAAAVLAQVWFLDRGVPVLTIPTARWGDTEQPAVRKAKDSFASLSDLNTVPFRIGETHELNVAIKHPNQAYFYAFDNSTYDHPNWEKPAYRLEGDTYDVIVRLRGVHLDQELLFKLRNMGAGAGLEFSLDVS